MNAWRLFRRRPVRAGSGRPPQRRSPVAAERPGQRIRVEIEDDVNGVGAAKRRACEPARGEILVEVDQDDLLAKACLAEVGKAFDAHPEAVFVHSNTALINEDRRPGRHPPPARTARAGPRRSPPKSRPATWAWTSTLGRRRHRRGPAREAGPAGQLRRPMPAVDFVEHAPARCR
jgi:hypothetical protein